MMPWWEWLEKKTVEVKIISCEGQASRTPHKVSEPLSSLDERAGAAHPRWRACLGHTRLRNRT